MNQLPEIPPSEHSLEWNERLQDWLDGELNGADTAAFEAHLTACAQCQQSVEEFEQLDTALIEASPPLQLNAAFDARLFAQIDTIDDSKRAEARRRIEQEWQQQIHALSRGWRRTLAFVIPGVVAGIAIAFALASWLDSSGMTSTLVAQGAAELGGGATDFLRIGVTAIIGAALGMLVAPWLARLVE
jgi:anti-sigma factor RsiW